VRVEGLDPRTRQPDIGILDLLERMGCRVERGADFAEVRDPTASSRASTST